MANKFSGVPEIGYLYLVSNFILLITIIVWLGYPSEIAERMDSNSLSDSQSMAVVPQPLLVNEGVKSVNVTTDTHDNKTRILILGIGHSATSYVQQFIGDVLFHKENVFYLFEALHSHTFNYQLSFYNDSTIGRAQILSFFYECKFHPAMDYSRGFLHHKTIRRINTWSSNVTHLKHGQTLAHKCAAANHLVYKEIGMGGYSNHLPYLWKRFPKLKVIAMVRNPISHIPSFTRMVKVKPTLNDNIWKFCTTQWKQIQYGLGTNAPFFVFKLEEFFDNITHKLNDTDTVKYYYQSVLNMEWNATGANNGIRSLNQVNVAYNEMRRHLWPWFNERQPVKESEKLNTKQKQHVADGCRAFNMFFGY